MLPFHDPGEIRRIELDLRPRAERIRALRESGRASARRPWLAAVAGRLIAPFALRQAPSPASSAPRVTPLPQPVADVDAVETERRCCA